MADINQFKIIKELYTGEQLTVYRVEDPKDGESGILRLIHQLPLRDEWNQLYHEYEAKITNYKHLPAVKVLDVWDDNKPFVLMEGKEGNFLEKEQMLTGKQIDQFVDAVVYLHKHRILHGKINRFNIWIKENGEITLYGAGERTVFQPDRKITIQDDLKQVLSILKNHSSLAESHFEGISFDHIEELQGWILRKLAIPKPGLVNLGESSKTVFESAIHEKNKREEPELVTPAPAPPKEKRKSGSLFIGVAAAVLLIIIIFSINFLKGGAEKTSIQASESKQETAVEKDNPKVKAVEKKDQIDLSQFTQVVSGWDPIEHASIKLAGNEYTLVAAAQKHDDSSGKVKVFVLSQGKKVGESPEYNGNSSETKSYIDSFLTITADNGQTGLLVFELPDDSGLISEVIALTVQANGSTKQVWSDYGTEVKQSKDVISVTGTELSNLSLKNNKFTLEKK
ncbi:protein kinase family protein [Priestia megaterium]|uniref:Protein kinase family protein n=1 Tax=Priestia megaterium TaxID=1404 RepID=A0A6H1PB62_PRIMG|nr:protein kinase family protein [Priestia megaterium]QIZ10652.1 protein kinase family protein [Priestia megaterium]